MSAQGPSKQPCARPGIQLENLRKTYPDNVAVDDLNLTVGKGELVAFLGPSGCGKTTSLRMIAGLTPITSGRVVVDGRDLTGLPVFRRDIGMVFQNYALFPHLDVRRNIAFGLEMRKLSSAEIARRVNEAIALVQLQGREGRRPAELSGGQQQRVALARALAIQPSLLLFDEPLSNLDAKLREEMRKEIRDIQKRLGITAIFVTHDQVEALTMCDRIAVLNHGRLEQLGTPQELYERPATPFVASFIGRTNRLAGQARGKVVEGAGWQLAIAEPHHGAVEVMVRPHRMKLAQSTVASPEAVNRVKGNVVRCIYAGEVIQTDVDIGGQIITVEQPNAGSEVTPEPGQAVEVTFLVRDSLVYSGAA